MEERKNDIAIKDRQQEWYEEPRAYMTAIKHYHLVTLSRQVASDL